MTEKRVERVEAPTVDLDKLSAADLAEALAGAGVILHSDETVGGACESLIVARRLYNLAMFALQERAPEVNCDANQQAVLIDAMKKKSAEPFERIALLQQLEVTIIPWLKKEITKERLRSLLENPPQDSTHESRNGKKNGRSRGCK